MSIIYDEGPFRLWSSIHFPEEETDFDELGKFDYLEGVDLSCKGVSMAPVTSAYVSRAYSCVNQSCTWNSCTGIKFLPENDQCSGCCRVCRFSIQVPKSDWVSCFDNSVLQMVGQTNGGATILNQWGDEIQSCYNDTPYKTQKIDQGTVWTVTQQWFGGCCT